VFASLTPPYVVSAPVTAANNGVQSYVVKVHDLAGHVVQSAPMTVAVDIRWDFIRPVEGFHSRQPSLVTTDAGNAVYYATVTDAWDVLLVKYDANGDHVWTRTFGGQDWETPRSINVDPSGRVYIAGGIYYPGRSETKPNDCFLAIFDPTGGLVRSLLIDGDVGHGNCVAASDASGNFYLAGMAHNSTQNWDFLAKYDRDGNALWNLKFRGTTVGTPEFTFDELSSLAIDRQGGVYVGGWTSDSFDGPPRGPRDVFVLKFDADGNRTWSRQYGSSGVFSLALQFAADPEGGVYVAGQTGGSRANDLAYKALLLSYSPDGSLRWARTLDGGRSQGGWGMVADLRGVYLVGWTSGIGVPQEITEPVQGEADGFLAKYSRSGDLLFVRLLGTPSTEVAQSVALGLNGDVYVAAWTYYDKPNSINTPILARHRDVP
jgi:hypothetical protein